MRTSAAAFGLDSINPQSRPQAIPCAIAQNGVIQRYAAVGDGASLWRILGRWSLVSPRRLRHARLATTPSLPSRCRRRSRGRLSALSTEPHRDRARPRHVPRPATGLGMQAREL